MQITDGAGPTLAALGCHRSSALARGEPMATAAESASTMARRHGCIDLQEICRRAQENCPVEVALADAGVPPSRVSQGEGQLVPEVVDFRGELAVPF
jgi:hypothetical protein